MAKKVLKIVGGVLGALVLIVVIYVVYVMASYYRLDDSLSLETASPEEGQVESAIELDTGSQGRAQEFTIVSANLGFGAYGPDFDFFMDGGSGSVAPSAQYVSDNINGSADAIEGLDPDIVLFQEVDIDGTRSHGVDEYALLRNRFPHAVFGLRTNYDSPYLAWPLYAPHGKNKAEWPPSRAIRSKARCAAASLFRRVSANSSISIVAIRSRALRSQMARSW